MIDEGEERERVCESGVGGECMCVSECVSVKTEKRCEKEGGGTKAHQ